MKCHGEKLDSIPSVVDVNEVVDHTVFDGSHPPRAAPLDLDAATPLTFDFELDLFQTESIKAINTGNSVLVVASTSAGLDIAAQFTTASGKTSNTNRWSAAKSAASIETFLTPRICGSAFFPDTATTLCPSSAAARTKFQPTNPLAPVHNINISLFSKKISALANIKWRAIMKVSDFRKNYEP